MKIFFLALGVRGIKSFYIALSDAKLRVRFKMREKFFILNCPVTKSNLQSCRNSTDLTTQSFI